MQYELTAERSAGGRLLMLRERRETAEVQLLLDGVNSNTAGIAEGYGQRIIASFNESAAASPAPGKVTARVALLYNPGLKSSWFILTGVLGILLVLNGSLVAARLGDRLLVRWFQLAGRVALLRAERPAIEPEVVPLAGGDAPSGDEATLKRFYREHPDAIAARQGTTGSAAAKTPKSAGSGTPAAGKKAGRGTPAKGTPPKAKPPPSASDNGRRRAAPKPPPRASGSTPKPPARPRPQKKKP